MHEIQKFAIENIYCSPAQDQQYRFKLVRVTRKNFPVKGSVTVCNEQRMLPNNSNRFHIYTIGNVPTAMLNLLRKDRNWFKNIWYNVESDMNARNVIVQIYDDNGVNIPRKNIYYSSGWSGELVIAIELESTVSRLFDVESLKYLRLYSNQYFDTDEFNDGTNRIGIYCESAVVMNNVDKVRLQTKINDLELRGGKTLVYVNGYYVDAITLDIPDNSIIEIVYDNSFISRESYRIGALRTFHSEKDDILKYIIFRSKTREHIQYEDDLEVYITHMPDSINKGLYYYQHKAEALSNITDKDFALSTQFVNTQAQYLCDKLGGSLTNKRITILTRKSGYNRKLIYSALKLHELYNLPDGKEFEVMSNTGYNIEDFRVEKLENSKYFQLASITSIKDITNTLSTDAVGYNGVNYYFGKTPQLLSGNAVDVPYLYRKESLAYEYDNDGVLKNVTPSTGPLYIASPNTKFVEFVQGGITTDFDKLYTPGEEITLRDTEYRVLIAQYDGVNRISTWEDITSRPSCSYVGNKLVVDETPTKRIRIFYFDRPHIENLELEHVDGILLFPLSVTEDRGDGNKNFKLDLPYNSIEVFLNGKRLAFNVDFFIDFPFVNIVNKTYIKYSDPVQKIHIRCTGFNLDKEKINNSEIRGFVNNGVLTRNNYYDIREDKVYSTFIDGKLTDNTTLRFSETDNTVRLNDALNGLTYTMSERMISIKDVTGTNTLPYYNSNKEMNTRISDLYNIIYPEPELSEFNIIGDHHYVYSTVVSKVIHDLLDGNIPISLYTNPYDDSSIINMINNNYRLEMKLDPVVQGLPDNIVEIHPHYGNDTVSVNLYQYRFLTNLVRIITNGKPNKINLSGYVTIDNSSVEVDITPSSSPGGITVL